MEIFGNEGSALASRSYCWPLTNYEE